MRRDATRKFAFVWFVCQGGTLLIIRGEGSAWRQVLRWRATGKLLHRELVVSGTGFRVPVNPFFERR